MLDLVARTHDRYTSAIDKMQADVIAADGDLEAVQDSAAWRDRELLAARVLYRLNWLRYEVAARYERSTDVRKRLLAQAQEGFGEFAGAGDPELAAESLLGRALCNKVLRKYDSAARDLRAMLEMKPGAELELQARLALTETYIAAGDNRSALTQSKALLGVSDRGETRAQAQFLRSKALLASLKADGKRYGASERRSMRIEAASALEELFKRGGYWQTKASQLIEAGIDDPKAWADLPAGNFVAWLTAESLRTRGECGAALPSFKRLLERGVQPIGARFGIGYCAYHEGRYGEASEALRRFVADTSRPGPKRNEAHYLAFKASENLAGRADADDATRERYAADARAFVDAVPQHPRAFEAWFRLGEMQRDAGLFEDCADSFEKVRGGDPAFETNARFLAGQCMVQAVLGRPESDPAPPALVHRAIATLDDFIAHAEKASQGASQATVAAITDLRARATVMAAGLVGRPGGGRMGRAPGKA